jgi:uncharacterized glyoxalase superfamily protein PhnB
MTRYASQTNTQELRKMTTQISPMLAVRDGRTAIAFYQQAFGATLLWELEGAVAGLSIDGAEFFLAEESPEYRGNIWGSHEIRGRSRIAMGRSR